MAKQIKRSEIAEKDLYKEIRDSAKKTVTKINSLNKSLKKTAEVIKTDLSSPLDKTVSGLTKLNTSVSKMNATMTESVKLDKAKAEALKVQKQAEQEIYKVEQQRQKALQQQMNTEKKVRVESERLAKTEAKRTKGLKDQNNAYKQLVIKTRDQKNESKRLGAEMLKLESSGKKNTKAYRQLSTSFNRVTRSAQKGDKALKKLDRRVGDNFRNVGNYRGALGKLSSGFASLGLAMGGAMIIRDVFNVMKDFDQAQANLASVLGVSRDQMKALTEQSKELGATTRFTASEVSELQLEFAKLGFTQEQIEGMTQSTLDLAGATGSELGETATIVGATMRGFGLDVSETQRVTDVMSKSFTTSSLDMSKFATAMASVAPVANLAGKTIEETTALIGTLTDRGIDASTAGTGLRNMFLKSNKAGLTFDEALEQIASSTDQTGEAMELFGTRGATLGVVLANNRDQVAKLTEGLDDAKGSTKEMADMQMQTLGGSIDLLKSAWQGLILSMDEAGGVGEKIRHSLRFIADNLGNIFKVLKAVGLGWLSYRISLKLVNKETGKFIGLGLVSKMRGMVKTLGLMTKGTRGASIGFKRMGNAIKTIPLAGFISMVATAVSLLWDFVGNTDDSTDALNKETKALNSNNEEMTIYGELRGKYSKDAEKLAKNVISVSALSAGQLKSNLATGKRLLEDNIALAEAQIGAESEMLENVKDAHKIRIVSTEAEAKAINDKITAEEKLFNKALANQDQGMMKFHQNRIDNMGGRATTQASLDLQHTQTVKRATDAELKRNTILIGNIKILEDEIALRDKQNKDIEKNNSHSEKGAKTEKGRNTILNRSVDILKEQNDLLENRNKLEENFFKLTNQTQIKDIDKDIKIQEKQQSENIALGIDFDESKLKDLINKRQKLVLEGIERTNEYIKGVESQKLDERFKKEREKIQSQATKLLAQDKLTADEKAKIEANLQIELDVIDEAEIIANKSLNESFVFMDKEKNVKIIEAKKDTALKLAEVDNNVQATIEGVYARQQKEFKLNLLKTKKTNEEVANDMLDFEIEQLEKKIEAYKKAGLKTLDLEIQLEELKRQETLKFDEQTINDKKSLADQELAIIQGLTNAYNELADKRIAKIDEEIKKSQQRYDNYVALAKNGNITAKESLAVESKLIAEANLRKEKEEKRKQRVQLASSVLQSYITNSANPNVKNPLAKTITDTVLLTEFIKSLPAFADGTEDTGANGRGIDGKGGFQAILHPNERVLTKDQNKLVGGMTNEDLSQLAYQYQNGLIVSGMTDGTNNMINAENQLLLKKLDSLENTIKNKPETNIELEEIIGGVMSITRQKKEGNTKIYNRYRVN